jgi:hypothetical protein
MGNQCSGSEFDMHVFSDADWAGDSSTQRSAACYTMRYWQAGDQSIINQSYRRLWPHLVWTLSIWHSKEKCKN